MEKKHVVKLTPKERKSLLSVVSKGQNKASVIRRAHILLKSDEGKTDRETSELLYISQETVRRTRRCFCQAGLNATLAGKPHPGATGKLDEYQEAYLIALACSDPPDGQARWTLKLLAKQLVNDSIVEGIAPETVRLVLKKTL
jgi:transposase